MSWEHASVYAFVRLDLPLEQQLVQLGHAIYGVASLWVPAEPGAAAPNMIVCGAPSLRVLERVARKCMVHGVPHFAWSEPDAALGFTALCTVPLTGWQRDLFKNYKLWSVQELIVNVLHNKGLDGVSRVAPAARQNGAGVNGKEKPACGELGPSDTNAPFNTGVAQNTERLVSNQEVGGANPSPGAKFVDELRAETARMYDQQISRCCP